MSIFLFVGHVADTKPVLPFFPQVLRVVKNKQVWLLGLYSGCQYAVMGSVAILWGVPFAKVLYHINTFQGALLIACIYFGAAAGAPLFGLLNNKIKDVRLLMGVTSLVTLCLFAIWGYLRLPIWGYCVFSFLIGVCAASYVLSFIHVRDVVVPEIRGTAIGFVNVLACIIGAPILQVVIGHLLGGKVTDLTVQHFHIAFIAVLPVLLLGALVSVFVRKNMIS